MYIISWSQWCIVYHTKKNKRCLFPAWEQAPFLRKSEEGESEMEVLQEYIVPVTMAICFCIGYLVKKWIKDIDNKWIPTICAVLGVIINIWTAGEITPVVLLGGLASGLAATGADQLVKQLTTKKGE